MVDWAGKTAILGVMTDIYERQEAAHPLLQSEKLYHRLVETSPDPIVLYDLNGDFISVNIRTAQIYGVDSIDEFLSRVKNIADLLGEEDKSRAMQNIKAAVEAGFTSTSEYTLYRKDRSAIKVDINSSVVLGPDGNPQAVMSVVRDITDRKYAESLLAIQHEMAKRLSMAADLKTGMEQVLEIAMQIEGIDCGGVYILNYGTPESSRPCSIELLAHAGVPQEFVDQVYSYGIDDPRALVIAKGEPLYTSHHEFAASWSLNEPAVEPYAPKALAIVPVKFEGKVKGAILVASMSMDKTPLLARQVLEGVAAQIGGVIARARVEEALRRSEENYRELLENANNIILRWESGGRITFMNEFGLRFFGYTQEELLGMDAVGTVIPETDETGRDLREMVARIYENPEKYQNNANENIKKNGERVWVSWTNRAIRDKQGNIIDIMSIGTDVTERRKAEEALRRSEERFRGYFNLPLIGVAVLSPEGTWIEVNEKICSILGYTCDELKTRKWMDLTPEEDLAEELRLYRYFLAGSESNATFEKRYVRKDGSLISAELSLHCVRSFGGKPDYLVAVIQDITDRKKSEEMLIQALKMESIGRLAGGVAHDLNNMLTPIIGYSDILLSDIHPDDPRHRSVTLVQKAAESAKYLTHQLLAFSRRQVLEMKLTDLNKIISGFEKILRRTIREDVEIRIRFGMSMGYVNADIGQIEQILMNLAVNAQDAMPNGGILTIRTDEVLFDESYPGAHPDFRPGRYVLLEMCDTGLGIDPHIMENIFEPFFTTKGRGMGTGLGLATIYGIVKQHDGFVNVYSEKGKGSCFKIYLPSEDGSPLPDEEALKELQTSYGKETILIAEDNEMVMNLATEILKRSGYTIVPMENAGECFNAISQSGRYIDLLLTDVIMPDMNGKDLYIALREKYPHIKVVYMSGYTEDVIAHHGVLDKGVDFIQKPFSAQNLLEKIREVLDRKALSEEIQPDD